MQNKQQNSIKLIPSGKPGIFLVELVNPFKKLVIGRYNQASGVFSCHRNEKKHLHRLSNSLAVNAEVLRLPNLRWISVCYTDCSGRTKELLTSRDYLLANGRRAAFKATGFEAQYFLELSKWNLQAVQQFEKQRNSQLQICFEAA